MWAGGKPQPGTTPCWGASGTGGRASERLHQIELEIPNPSHPVVCVHPESGRKVLFVNWHFTTYINELPEEESRIILDYLRNRVLQPEYQLRVRWEPNMVVVWDNRSVQHYAPKDYFPQQRQMERVTIAGHAPIPAESGPPVEIPRVTVTDLDQPVPAQV
jgi:taurine dioxygenase